VDYELMYPPTYQNETVDTEVQTDPYVKNYGLRFSYGYQFDVIRETVGSDVRILDYGCGTGHFIANAMHYGFQCDGAEYNQEYIKSLKKNIPRSNFYLIDDFVEGRVAQNYDVIRMSNVLEHISNPHQVIEHLKNRLSVNGILLIEGPIEDNFNLAELVRKLYFRIFKWIAPGRTVQAPPYHIFFSNAKNQRGFFKDCGFDELHFNTAEDAWPFPESIKRAKGAKDKIMAVIAILSKKVTRTVGMNWGNIFIYCGKVKS
jgi:SAM-dependent methyltransferase